MSKMSTELSRRALNGATMGTRWSAVFFAEPGLDTAPLERALQEAVSEVDQQMSNWKPDSDLMRINHAPVGEWVTAPPRLLAVLGLGLAIGRASGGAFDIGLGDAATAWGFGPDAASGDRIRSARSTQRRPSWELLELEQGRLRKHGPITLDLNGIAKGYGVDRLAETMESFGIRSFLVGLDGEMRAAGLRPDGMPWSIAVEQPDHACRAVHSVLMLEDAAVATSGDYRHFVDVQGRRLSHTMNPMTGAPLQQSPASVTVVARSCAEADAWATALMVLGRDQGVAVAQAHRLHALFLMRGEDGAIAPTPAGPLFAGAAPARAEHSGP